MFLKTFILRDWKQYVSARFDFSATSPSRNIALIGAKNGYGKTGLFEAFVLGLFGRDGLPLIARAPFTGGSDEKLQMSYTQFLEKALHANAISEGRNSCSINFIFEDESESPIEIKRTWTFSQQGKFLRPSQNEDVQIYVGVDREPVGPTSDEVDGDRLNWYREFIQRTFVPAQLAAFFVFDGERVGEFADREMSMQVKFGIEGLLGIPLIKELASDLRRYAANKRVPSKDGRDTLQELELSRGQLEKEIGSLEEEKFEKSSAHRLCSSRVEKLINELAGFGTGTQAQMQDLVAKRAEIHAEIKGCQDRLKVALKDDLALAVLACSALGGQVRTQLVAEGIREAWFSGKDAGAQRLDKFQALLSSGVGVLEPRLTAAQWSQLKELVEHSWEVLWYPEPDGCASSINHGHVVGADRDHLLEVIKQKAAFGAGSIIADLEKLALLRQEDSDLSDQIAATSSLGPQLDAKKSDLEQARAEHNVLYARLEVIENNLKGLSGQLDSVQKQIASITKQADSRLPDVRRAQRALAVASMIDSLVEKAVPEQIQQVAAAMTSAYKKLAHKQDHVANIQITDDCEVKLLNPAGRDLREYDLAAGEKQIFTQALISAIVEVSGKKFPLIIDTPLGRLDDEHRFNVLRHLAERDGQVVMLSSPTEVIGPYLDSIRTAVAKTYTLKFEGTKDMGWTRVVDGYFGES